MSREERRFDPSTDLKRTSHGVIEHRALMELHLEPPAFRVPRSCVSAAAEAEKEQNADYDRKDAQLLEMPSVRYCLGLKSIEERLYKTQDTGNCSRRRILSAV